MLKIAAAAFVLATTTTAHAQSNSPGKNLDDSSAPTASPQTTLPAGAPTPQDSYYVPAPQEQTIRDREAKKREQDWEARCKPVLHVDKEGISRYRYAKSDCDVYVLTH